MRIEVTKCDNPNCGMTTQDKLVDVTFDGEDLHKKMDLCPTCAKKVIEFISSGFKIKDDKPESTTKTKITGLSSKSNNVDSNKEILKEAINATNTNKRGKLTKCDIFGKDKLIDLYINQNKPAKEIAEMVGVPKTTVDEFFRKHGIRKHKSKKVEVDPAKEGH